MTITISKKEAVYLVSVALLLIALGVGAFAVRRGNTDELRVEASPVNASFRDAKIEIGTLPTNTTPLNHPHPSCYMRVVYLLPKSAVFNGSNPYNVAFMGGDIIRPAVSVLQDINGDSLPDFVYAYNETNVGGFDVNSRHVSCIYLNNGNGWTKAYECYASTTINTQTGQVSPGVYAGDCAGAPSRD